MLDCDEPDKFSIITYVSQFYHLLKVSRIPIRSGPDPEWFGPDPEWFGPDPEWFGPDSHVI